MKKILIWIEGRFGKEVIAIVLFALIAGSILAHLIIKFAPSLQSIALRISIPLAIIVIFFIIIVRLIKKE